MRRTWIYDKDGNAHEYVREPSQHHFVQPDFEEYGGRTKWRERLKANDTIELSPKELAQARDKWNSKKADFNAKLATGEKLNVRPVDTDVMAAPAYERSRLNKELLNRLDGRPVPERKMLIKLALETNRMLRGR